MAKSPSIDLELFELVATRTNTVSQAKMAQAFVRELIDHPSESHTALEFGVNGLLNIDASTLLSLSILPEDAYSQFHNAFEAWVIIGNSIIEEIDDKTKVLCRKIANVHLRKLQELELECVGSTSHDEAIVIAVTIQIVAIMMHNEWDEYLTNFFSMPWFSSEEMRTILADLSPVWKLYYGAEEDE